MTNWKKRLISVVLAAALLITCLPQLAIPADAEEKTKHVQKTFDGTRAGVVMMLWTMAGKPKANIENKFTDIKETDAYYDAVLWAVEHNVTKGMTDTTFSPDYTCTRGQAVTFIYRAADTLGLPGRTKTYSGSFLFDDVKSEKAFYFDPVYWAVYTEWIELNASGQRFYPDYDVESITLDAMFDADGNMWTDQLKVTFPEVGDPDAITHLIFADMAYANIPSDYKNKNATVSEWVNEKINKKTKGSVGYSKNKMMAAIFKEEYSDMNRVDVYQMVGDWRIVDVINGEGGYAANVFQKGNDIIIAYRGSEEGPGSMFEKDEDWAVDMKFAIFNYLDPRQFGAALNTYRKYSGQGNVTLTGHSLGGALVAYVSILTGAKGYSFDGAAGHVVDLTYLFEPMAIDFHSKNQISFTNYTDKPLANTIAASVIQHTNADLFPGFCYQTNNQLAKSSYGPFWAHEIYSITEPSGGGKSLGFTKMVEPHDPKDNWYASVEYSMRGFALNAAQFFSGSASSTIFSAILDYVAARLVKKGNVILGSEADDMLSVADMAKSVDRMANVTKNVIYGGDGSDNLIGAASGDVLIPGDNSDDILSGGLGSDVYLIDTTYQGDVFICDQAGDNVIVLKNSGSLSYGSVTAIGDAAYSGCCGFKLGNGPTVYLTKTLIRHSFTVVNDKGEQIAVIDTKGNCSKPAGKRGAEEQAECKEITIEGESEISIYSSAGDLVAQYGAGDSGLFPAEYGVVYISDSEEKPLSTVTLYADYTLRVNGEAPVDVAIVGTDEEGNVDHVTVAEAVDLSKGEAAVVPEEHLVTQDGESVVTDDHTTAVSVQLNKKELRLEAGKTAKLSAQAVYAGGKKTNDVFWISADSSVVTCEPQEDGSCEITAVAAGETEVYAAADDSGVFAACKVTVTPPKTDKTALKDVISEAKGIDQSKYTEKTAAALEEAIDNAEKVQADKNATQKAVDAAVKEVKDAIAALKEKPGGTDKPSQTSKFRFDDVKNQKAFYFEPVYWAYNANPQITNGLDKSHFGPDAGCTRGQVVTFLWRAAKCPEPKSTKTKFKDVGEKAFYAKAVAWAVEQGITKGMSETSFAPDATCTRGQIVTFLWRFRKSPAPKRTKTDFSDVGSGAFYAKAVAWAVENGVTNGMDKTHFAPDATCTRGQIVTFLYRAMTG